MYCIILGVPKIMPAFKIIKYIIIKRVGQIWTFFSRIMKKGAKMDTVFIILIYRKIGIYELPVK